ncbi:winged helix-turn-helix domain-containing protein [Bordetella genomosp. 9]|uniref:OmpR/PhoB-type domain-containing protein n=1 Tax=Bordetella genomosp. 9 TaxID=1416803 RepID=A0A1W6Z067_9BORD|nr:response regulator transcription factor [Bordetella genomosp. 9]ARP86755.1 hypothetical protein CAL13_11460 [Bordetella genomosp. 9]
MDATPPFGAVQDGVRPAPIYRFADWTFDTRSRVLRRPDGLEVVLTGAECDVLLVFLTRPNQVLTREQLLRWTRGRDARPYDRTIDVQLSRLRRKLGDTPKAPAMIKTVRGGGYQFVARVQREGA